MFSFDAQGAQTQSRNPDPPRSLRDCLFTGKSKQNKQAPLARGVWGVENPKPLKGASLGGLGWAQRNRNDAALKHSMEKAAFVAQETP